MNHLRRLILAAVILALLICAWYGAEMLIHGQSQRSAVDTFIAICIALSISGRVERGVEANERKQEFAKRFAEEFIKHAKERQEKNGENGSRTEV